MISFLIAWVLSTIAIMITAYLIKGFEISNFFSALMAAVVIGLVNAFCWPLLFAFAHTLLTPIGVWIITPIINGILLKIAAAVVPGFEIRTFGAAIFGAIVLALFQFLLDTMFGGMFISSHWMSI